MLLLEQFLKIMKNYQLFLKRTYLSILFLTILALGSKIPVNATTKSLQIAQIPSD